MDKKDIVRITRYVTDLKVTKFLTWKPYKNKDDIQKYLEYAITCHAFPDEIFCIYFNNKIIGTAHLLSRNNGNTQIGFGIFSELWNKGLGHKTASKIIQHIKNSKWLQETKQIIVIIHKDNIYAQRMFIKLNFFLEQENAKKNFDRYMLYL